jgi:hypothetical protein
VNDPVVKLSIMDWFSLVHTTLDPMVMNRLYAIGQVRRRRGSVSSRDR